jgi:hypothetical protein
MRTEEYVESEDGLPSIEESHSTRLLVDARK